MAGGAIISNYTGMSVAELRGLIDRRTYAVTSGRAAGMGYDEMVDRLASLDDVIRYSRLVLAKGQAVSGASSTQWTAFRTAINAGSRASRTVTAAIGTAPDPSSGGGTSPSTTTATNTGTDPSKPYPSTDDPPERPSSWPPAETQGSEEEGGGFFDSPLLLAGVVGVGVMLFALVAGRK